MLQVLHRYRGRRGCMRLASIVARYSGLPIERARSGAEVRALEVLRASGRPLPQLPIWLDIDLGVTLDLEASYEDTCRVLRIA